jgi:hypothetical protein
VSYVLLRWQFNKRLPAAAARSAGTPAVAAAEGRG